MPSNSSALVTLIELEEGTTIESEGEVHRPFEYSMAAAAHNTGPNPTSLSDARSRDDWPHWDASIQWELDQHTPLRTWDLVEPPDGANIVGSRLVFHYKHDVNGNVVAHKTRLVTQGFTQTLGIDYNETFSPTAKLSAIRIIITITIRNDWELE
jgi:Reverse transcriptase (RNA-dependent DNA polymerase)